VKALREPNSTDMVICSIHWSLAE